MPQRRHQPTRINNRNTRPNTIPRTIHLPITTNNPTKPTLPPSTRRLPRLRSHLPTPHTNIHRHSRPILKHHRPIRTTKRLPSTRLQLLIPSQNLLPSHLQQHRPHLPRQKRPPRTTQHQTKHHPPKKVQQEQTKQRQALVFRQYTGRGHTVRRQGGLILRNARAFSHNTLSGITLRDNTLILSDSTKQCLPCNDCAAPRFTVPTFYGLGID